MIFLRAYLLMLLIGAAHSMETVVPALSYLFCLVVTAILRVCLPTPAPAVEVKRDVR